MPDYRAVTVDDDDEGWPQNVFSNYINSVFTGKCVVI